MSDKLICFVRISFSLSLVLLLLTYFHWKLLSLITLMHTNVMSDNTLNTNHMKWRMWLLIICRKVVSCGAASFGKMKLPKHGSAERKPGKTNEEYLCVRGVQLNSQTADLLLVLDTPPTTNITSDGLKEWTLVHITRQTHLHKNRSDHEMRTDLLDRFNDTSKVYDQMLLLVAC